MKVKVDRFYASAYRFVNGKVCCVGEFRADHAIDLFLIMDSIEVVHPDYFFGRFDHQEEEYDEDSFNSNDASSD